MAAEGVAIAEAVVRLGMRNRIVVAYGRDAADVALATMFGNFTMQNMQVTVTEHRPQFQP